MDFKDQLKQLSDRISKLREQIKTEEATKNAFIMPFIQILGYDVFNPMEVVPEMNCDLVKKKGEKIDYAILKEGEPIILFECKHWEQDLNLHSTQLQKYFVASKAKFGVLTNGVVYRFYTDLSKPNLMDEVPFLEINLEGYNDSQIEELKKFHKSYFDIGNILSSAGELKYMNELKSVIKREFSSPSGEFVKFLAKQVYEDKMTQRVLEQFTNLVKRSIANHINDTISERLNIAMQQSEGNEVEQNQDENETGERIEPKNKIVTTEEEIESYYIVKSILRSHIAAERITYRDAVSYFCVFCDDNNRKLICRMYFNSSNKYIAIPDENKAEVRHKIDTLDDIYKYQDEIINVAMRYV